MKITKSQLKQIIKEEISITELESWATEELEPVINQVLQRLGVVERKLKIDPSAAIINERAFLTPEQANTHVMILHREVNKIKERLKTLPRGTNKVYQAEQDELQFPKELEKENK